MDENFIEFNGQEVIPEWPERLKEDQKTKIYIIKGKVYYRIPYGKEKNPYVIYNKSCRECAALEGQLHAIGCFIEECPACGEQAVFLCDE